MALQGIQTGMIAGGTYLPATGRSGVLPAAPAMQNTRKPGNLGAQVNQKIKQSVFPPVPNGEGYTSKLTRKVVGMDVVRGMDRTLGKTAIISIGKRMSMSMKNYGNFSTQQALGPLSGKMERAYL